MNIVSKFLLFDVYIKKPFPTTKYVVRSLLGRLINDCNKLVTILSFFSNILYHIITEKTILTPNY